MKSKNYAILVLLVIAIPYSLSVVAVEPNYWPVSEGEVLYYSVNDGFSEAYGGLNLTIDTIHTNGTIDYHTTVEGSPGMATLVDSGSALDILSLIFDDIVLLYSTEEFSKISWVEEFTDVQEYWESQSNFYRFWGKNYKYNRYKYVVTRKLDGEQYLNFEIEYSDEGILNRYEYGEIGAYNEDWESYEYISVEWEREIDRSIPVVGYIVFSITMVGLGVLATKVGLMWKKERNTR